jgi:anaerobic ribonucleoside-triphosphate reductase activating protein
MNVFVSRVHFPITTLGFGRRIGIWFQGCSIRCPGCISADTWPKDKGRTTWDALQTTIKPWLRDADGLTVSGGEPFEQQDALEQLLRFVRRTCRGDVLVYSGQSWEALAPKIDRYCGLIDVLVTDPFDASAGQTLALRGSDNQRMILLTDLGRERYTALLDARVDPHARTLDMVLDEDGNAWLAGIPRLDDMPRLRELLEAQGFSASLTQASGRK